MIPGQTKKRLPRCCPVVPSLPTCILSIKVTCTSMLFSWCSWRVRSNNSGFRSPERLCILYYIMKLLDWCSVFILSWIWKKTFWRSKQNQNIFEHSTVNLFAGCLCIIIYIRGMYWPWFFWCYWENLNWKRFRVFFLTTCFRGFLEIFASSNLRHPEESL